MDATELCFAGAAEQVSLIRSGEISAAELIDATLARIEQVNPKINAFNAVFAEEARSEAAAADASGDPTRPLHGVPVAVKDNLDIAGHVTSLGTKAFATAAPVDDQLISSLRTAGAIIIGKTNMSELAVWPFTETDAWGATRNPWDLSFSPGGSSGGSGAAAAAGLCGLAVGSDGLGSVRVPSSFCGLFGLKPQRDRVWHDDNFNWYAMSVNGPLTRTVADAALFLDAACVDHAGLPEGSSFQQAAATAPRPLRIALAWKSAATWPIAAILGDEQRGAVEATASVLRGLGHTVEEHEVGFPQSMSINYIIRYLKGVSQQRATLERPTEIAACTRQMATIGDRIPAKLLQKALDGEPGIAARVNKVFSHYDVVLTPGAVQEPLRVGSLNNRDAVRTLYASGRKIPNFAPWNCIGHPAVSVPAGFSKLGLPLSVQLAGRAHDEATLLALASQLEVAQPWAHEKPKL